MKRGEMANENPQEKTIPLITFRIKIPEPLVKKIPKQLQRDDDAPLRDVAVRGFSPHFCLIYSRYRFYTFFIRKK